MPQHIQYGGLQFTHSGELLADARAIIDAARHAAQQSVNVYLVARNWLLGRRIAEEELGGAERAGYGQKIVRQLAQDLTREYGKGFDFGSLYKFVRFYREFPDILDSASPKSRLLSWTHYRVLLQVDDAKARAWYEREAAQEMWSVRTLQRNVSSQYYARMLATPRKDLVKSEMQALTASHQADRLEFVKSPVIAEFLGFPESAAATLRESELEDAIISNIQKFLLEMGKGYAFVARQKHIRTEKEDYFIDLVFYNYILKCFVLLDLKTSKITHQDVGQMDMYVRMYDELLRGEGDGPTLGIVLCADTDEDIARYSVLRGNEQLFAAKYKTALPDEDKLRAEIEAQKALFQMQHAEQAKG